MNILELKSVEIYYDRIKVIDGISLSMKAGDFVTVLGSNGAGKAPFCRSYQGSYSVTLATLNSMSSESKTWIRIAS